MLQHIQSPSRTQREQLECALVSGAAAHLAANANEADQIAEGIKKVLDKLHPLHPLPVLFNPHTGTPRDHRDIASDPQAILCVKPGEPLKAAPITLPVVAPGPDALEREIQTKAKKGPRVTPEDIEAEIESEHYFNAFDGIAGAAYNEASPDGVLRQFTFEAPGALGQLTFCVLVLRNGTKVVGVNYGAIDPAQHSAERGRQEARAQAVDKVYELLGFRLRDELARPVLTDADAAADLAGTPRPS